MRARASWRQLAAGMPYGKASQDAAPLPLPQSSLLYRVDQIDRDGNAARNIAQAAYLAMVRTQQRPAEFTKAFCTAKGSDRGNINSALAEAMAVVATQKTDTHCCRRCGGVQSDCVFFLLLFG